MNNESESQPKSKPLPKYKKNQLSKRIGEFKEAHKALTDQQEEINKNPKYEPEGIDKVTVMDYRYYDAGNNSSLTVHKTARWYLVAILSVLGLEWLVNYSSFYDKFPVPWFAASMTIIVGSLIFIGGHHGGVLMKQPDERNKLLWRKDKDIGAVVMATLAFLASLAALIIIGWARHDYLSGTLGILLDQSVWPAVTYTLMMNIGILILGCVLSFYAHSEGKYGKDLKKLNRLKNKYTSCKKKLDKLIRGMKVEHEDRHAEIYGHVKDELEDDDLLANAITGGKDYLSKRWESQGVGEVSGQ